MHADRADPVPMLVGRVLDKTDVELLADLDRGLRQARDLFSIMLDDPVVRRRYGDDIESFQEDEGNASELCWMWEKEDD